MYVSFIPYRSIVAGLGRTQQWLRPSSSFAEMVVTKPVIDGKVSLTERELETLTWAARGETSYGIAQVLGLTKRTVDFHIDNTRTKLNATACMHASIKAQASQMITS